MISRIYVCKDRWDALAEADLRTAETYGLRPEDFDYILSILPVLARKSPEFFAYLRERVREWKEKMHEASVYVPQPHEAASAAEKPEPYNGATDKSKKDGV